MGKVGKVWLFCLRDSNHRPQHEHYSYIDDEHSYQPGTQFVVIENFTTNIDFATENFTGNNTMRNICWTFSPLLLLLMAFSRVQGMHFFVWVSKNYDLCNQLCWAIHLFHRKIWNALFWNIHVIHHYILLMSFYSLKKRFRFAFTCTLDQNQNNNWWYFTKSLRNIKVI